MERIISKPMGLQLAQKQQCQFANIYMVEIETNLIQQSDTKPREWKHNKDDIFSLWVCNRKDVELFIKEANNFHPTIKFTAEISDNEITFLDTIVFQGERLAQRNPSWTSKPAISGLKPFNRHTLPCATLWG